MSAAATAATCRLEMNDYHAPLADMKFVLRELVDRELLAQLPGFDGMSLDVAESVLDEAAKFASGVLSPLNQSGDVQGARWQNGQVLTADGWKEAYARFVADGWAALSCPAQFGGQNLPRVLSALIEEMWNGANVAFALCPMLTRGTVDAIELRGADSLKDTYLSKLVSGEWTGTMNLTEPQAGSDLAAVRTKAVPDGDHYRLYGQKIFITWGDHDMTGNVIHLVLARTPDAPEGVRGISLFVVPQFLLNAESPPVQRNDVHCVSLEHKLGIHASPTCVMSFGDQGGAIGYLVGQENKGLAHMFTMMNEARQKVGIQGLAVAERAYQQAREYAKERVQGRLAASKSGGAVAIIHHPDVRRMLMTMKSQIEAMRAFAYVMAADMDRAHRDPDAGERARRQVRVDLLIPVLKAWCTELGVEIASTGVQVHGGMGYIEETGAAQHLRDARIAPIYEGTNGIQANDLVARKLGRDGGSAAKELIAEMRALDGALAAAPGDDLAEIRRHLSAGLDALASATDWMAETVATDMPRALAGSVPYLRMLGAVVSGWLIARGALAAQATLAQRPSDARFLEAKLLTARFFAEHRLALAPPLWSAITGGATVVGFDPDLL